MREADGNHMMDRLWMEFHPAIRSETTRPIQFLQIASKSARPT
jgi:hypothetical protein